MGVGASFVQTNPLLVVVVVAVGLSWVACTRMWVWGTSGLTTGFLALSTRCLYGTDQMHSMPARCANRELKSRRRPKAKKKHRCYRRANKLRQVWGNTNLPVLAGAVHPGHLEAQITCQVERVDR